MSFRIVDSPVMEADLVKKFPDIKSYRGQSIDDLRVSVRADFSPRGFNATILTADKMISISPARYDDMNRYVSYYGDEFQRHIARLRRHRIRFRSQTTKSADLFDGLITKETRPASPPARRSKNIVLRLPPRRNITTTRHSAADRMPNAVASLNTWVNAVNADLRTRIGSEIFAR